MCYITATELKQNLSHYMELSNTEDVYVTKNGKILTILTSPRDKAFKEFMKLKGVFQGKLKEGEDYRDIIAEEMMKR